MTLKKRVISTEDVAYFKWDLEKGIILKKRRLEQRLTLKQLSQRLKEYGVVCGLDYISTLEHGRVDSLKADKLCSLLETLEIELDYFYKN